MGDGSAGDDPALRLNRVKDRVEGLATDVVLQTVVVVSLAHSRPVRTTRRTQKMSGGCCSRISAVEVVLSGRGRLISHQARSAGRLPKLTVEGEVVSDLLQEGDLFVRARGPDDKEAFPLRKLADDLTDGAGSSRDCKTGQSQHRIAFGSQLKLPAHRRSSRPSWADRCRTTRPRPSLPACHKPRAASSTAAAPCSR